LKRLHVAIADASKRLDEAGDLYDGMKPERSEALIRRPVDADFVQRYENTPFCTDRSVDALRGQVFVDWDFTRSVPGHEDRLALRRNEVRQRRAYELITALDEYRAANEDAIERSGCTPAEDALEALQDERQLICDQMLQVKPTTLRGLQALATALVYAEWFGDLGNRPNESLEDEMLVVILGALCEESLAAA
jgi:hypothetical protein